MAVVDPRFFRFELMNWVFRKKRWCLWIILAIATLGINGLWSGYTYWNYRVADHKQRQTAQRYEELQKNIQSLIKDQSKLNRWRDRLIVLDKLGRYLDYGNILNFLSKNSPELITLSNLEFRRDKQTSTTQSTTLPKGSQMFLINNASSNPAMTLDPVTMTLKGQSANHKTVADYLKILNASDLFLKTQFINSKRKNLGSTTAIYFEIKCTVSPFQSLKENNYAHVNQTKTF